MAETITLIDTSDKAATEGMRQMFRKLWADPKNGAFRAALQAQTENYRWVTLDGADPLPEVK